ncbi:hypothetical protein D3C72_1717260 [compost metagenome]
MNWNGFSSNSVAMKARSGPFTELNSSGKVKTPGGMRSRPSSDMLARLRSFRPSYSSSKRWSNCSSTSCFELLTL